MFRDTLTADGYTNAIEVPIGGAAEVRITKNSGTGTITFKRAHKSANGKGTASEYAAFDSTTTVTDTTALGVQLSEGLYCFQLSSGSTPSFTVELASADSNHVTIKDSGTQVA